MRAIVRPPRQKQGLVELLSSYELTKNRPEANMKLVTKGDGILKDVVSGTGLCNGLRVGRFCTWLELRFG